MGMRDAINTADIKMQIGRTRNKTATCRMKAQIKDEGLPIRQEECGTTQESMDQERKNIKNPLLACLSEQYKSSWLLNYEN